RRATAAVLWARLRIPLLVASATAAALALAGIRSVSVVAVAFLATGLAASSARQLAVTVPSRHPRAVVRVLRSQRGYWGGQLAHLGVAVVAVVIAVSGGLADRAAVTLGQGQSVRFAGYSVSFERTEQHRLADRLVTDAHIAFRAGGQVIQVAQPRLSSFAGQRQAVAEPSVWSGPTRDIYIALADLSPGQVTLNLYRYPLMSWLWVGGLLVMAGGLWALGGRSRRRTEPGAPTPEEVLAHA
ncbi:MAG: cytochrome C biogenesis protein CcmF, partial [Pseudonocardiales bacterium]